MRQDGKAQKTGRARRPANFSLLFAIGMNSGMVVQIFQSFDIYLFNRFSNEKFIFISLCVALYGIFNLLREEDG
jgi:hypothetical protein